MDKFWSFKRFYLLLKYLLASFLRPVLLFSGVFFGVIFLISLLSLMGSQTNDVVQGFYTPYLFLFGLYLTTLFFSDLKNSQSTISFLMIPASMFEKFLGKLLITTLGVILSSLILYFVYSVVLSFTSQLLFQKSSLLFNPFRKEVWEMIASFVVLQSLLFFGEIYFKKSALLKTLLSILCLSIAMGIYFIILLWILSDKGNFVLQNQFNFNGPQLMEYGKGVNNVLTFLFWWLMAPFFWFLSYIRLTEKEV